MEPAKMKEALRILMLEDTPTDAELMEHELRKAGLAFTVMRVQTRDAYVRALGEFRPDIILSDYHLPDFNGKAALEIARRDHPEIPVIMVTGALPDIEAVELIHAGAKDYVLKDRLARLGPAVQRALAAEQSARERRMAEEKIRKISESAQDAIIMMEPDGRISFWNAAAERIFGYTAAEAMGRELHILIAPSGARDEFAHGYTHFLESGEGPIVGKLLELTALRKSGEAFPVELTVSAAQLSGQWHAIGIVRDITERKQVEAALARHTRDLGERVKEMECLRDITNLLLDKDRAMDRVLDACVRRIPAAWLDPSHTCARICLGEQTFVSAQFRETEWKLATTIYMSGMEHGHVEVFYSGAAAGDGKSPFLDEERALLQSIATQITQSLDSRLAEKELRDSELRYRNLVETTSDIIWETDEHLRYTYISPQLFPTLGYKSGEFIGRTPFELMPPGEAERVSDSFGMIVAEEKSFTNLENTNLHKDGHQVVLETSGIPVIDAEGKFCGYRGIDRDITERKRAEIALNHSNRALATLSAVNRNLTRMTSEAELLQAVCQNIVELGRYRMAWVGYKQHDENKSIKTVARAGHDEGYLDTVDITWAETERGMGPTGRAIRSGTTQLCQDFANDPRHLSWRNAALNRGYAASISLPLANGEVFGALTVYAEEVNAFVPDEVGLLEEMANDLAFGVRALHTSQERDLALKQSQQHLEQLQDSLEDSVRAIASIVEMRDPYTAGHQVRVADLAAAIAVQMGLSDEQAHAIHLAGVVHDLGKIQIPAEILSKPGKITDIEFSLIKTHPQAGYDILKDINFPWPIAQMVLQHHERVDGSGYPQGLKGDEILLGARILSVADVVEAMFSHRPYRAGLGMTVALEEIAKGKGRHYDPAVVEACISVVQANGMKLPSSVNIGE
ncbi:MAG: PAS domain S-box protein [Nitrosomonadales bacterium]|nr:PAS domain S-box protein [Nitrosomonadales bacterium]